MLIAAVSCGAVLAGALVLLPGPWRDDGGSPPGPADRALAAARAGAPAAAKDLLVLIGEREARVRDRPRDRASWAVLGAAYVEQGRRTGSSAYYPKAERALRAALPARPGRADAGTLTGLAALANARHDFGAARKWGEAALARSPKHWTTYPVLLDTYEGIGDGEAADAALDRLFELRPGPAAQAGAAAVYRVRGWREDAAAALSDAAATAPLAAQRAAYLHRAGELAWERGEPQEALGYYRAALRAEPAHGGSAAGQGRALAALGRTREAVGAYQRATAGHPLPETVLEAGELLQSLGLRDAAEASYGLLRHRAARDGANGVNEALALGRFEADHGDPRAAVQRLTAEWKRHRSPAVADALGWALHRAGHDKAALGHAARAMKEGPRVASVAYHRGEIERSLGRYGAARRHISEALRINPHFSPLLVPAAKDALAALGDPPQGGPADLYGAPVAPRPPTAQAGPQRTGGR